MDQIKESNIKAGLSQLSSVLQEIKALLEWAELSRTEKTRSPSTEIWVDHNIEYDLRNAIGMFIKMAMDLREILKQGAKPQESDRIQYQRRYMSIVRQYQTLGTSVRFIKPAS